MRESERSRLIVNADDVLVVGQNREEHIKMLRMITCTLPSFWLRLAESKTVAMTWNTTEEVRLKKSHIEVKNMELDDERQFR